MAALNREQMRDLVKDNLGINDDDTHNTNINTWLNFALRDIQRRHDWTDLENESNLDTVDGTKTYSLDTSLSMIMTLRISDYVSATDTYTGSRELFLKSQAELDQIMPRVEQHAEGKPVYAVWFGKKLSLAPIPNSTPYRITYRWKKRITEFANDAAFSGILEVDDVLVARASWYGWNSIFEDAQNASMWNTIYGIALLGAMREDRRKPAWSPRATAFRQRSVALVSPNDPFYRNP